MKSSFLNKYKKKEPSDTSNTMYRPSMPDVSVFNGEDKELSKFRRLKNKLDSLKTKENE